jgi:CDP-diacylglycerol--glycerol-3-phosphate 3-phosphatidyltransferase
MASIYEIKPTFQNVLRPLANFLAHAGITPNQVTITALFISSLSGALITCYPTATWPLLAVPFVLLFRMMLNAIDGMIAREHDQQTALGIYLNELGDVLSDTFIYLPFSLVPGVSSVLVVTCVILSIVSEMAGIIGFKVGGDRRYEGPMGKSDRAFVFAILALLLRFGFYYEVNIILCLMIPLLLRTIFNRMQF